MSTNSLKEAGQRRMPVKPKIVTPPPLPKHPLTDEELNKPEEPLPVIQETSKSHTQRIPRTEHSEAAARRRSLRASRRREK